MNKEPLKDLVDFLNKIAEIDENVIQNLIMHSVDVDDEKIIQHPTIQVAVGKADNGYEHCTLSMLGLLNGWTLKNTNKVITIQIDEDTGKCVGFELKEKWW